MDNYATIYWDSGTNNVTRIDQQRQMSRIIEKYVPHENLSMVNVVHDYGLQKRILIDSNGVRGYPTAYIGTVRVGLLHEVEEADRSGYLKTLTTDCELSSSLILSVRPSHNGELITNEKDSSSALDSAKPVNLVDHEVTSWMSPVDWYAKVCSWIASDSTSTPNPIATSSEDKLVERKNVEEEKTSDSEEEEKKQKESDEISLKFLVSWWYYFSQERTFKFKETEFERIDEANKVVKACFKYNDVEELQIASTNSAVIKFVGGKHQDQYLYSTVKEDFGRLVQIITSRADQPSKIIVKRL